MNTKKEQVQALQRLLVIARRDTNQARHVADFLLALYNGVRFRCDLSNFRCLDTEIVNDCTKVIKLDASATREIQNYVIDGNVIFEHLARDKCIFDYSKGAKS